MALQINPNIGTPLAGGDTNAPATTNPNGVPNQDTANQLADLLQNPNQESGASTQTSSPFGSPFKAPQNPDKPATESAPSPFSAPAKPDAKTAPDAKAGSPLSSTSQASSTPQSGANLGGKEAAVGSTANPTPNTASPFTAQAKPENKTAPDGKVQSPIASDGQATSTPQSGGSAASNTTTNPAANTASPFTAQAEPEAKPGFEAQGNAFASSSANTTSNPTTLASSAAAQSTPTVMGAKPDVPTGDATNFTAQASVATNTSTSNMPNTTMSANTAGVGAPTQAQSGVSDEIKESVKPGSESLSDAQLAAAASMNAAVGIQPGVGTTATTGLEEVAQPHVDGEKIEAMMKSVTKELGMRDLSNLKLGGEMTLKLDQGALPNTEVKVRFEGNEMVISIDSKTADVNQFCTDNLSLLQQSVSSGMKEEMKVRIEVRNPPDQPNQRKDEQGSRGGQGGQGGQSGNQSGSQQQSQNSEGDSLAS